MLLGYVGRYSGDEGCSEGIEYGKEGMRWLMEGGCCFRSVQLSIVEHEEGENLFPILGFLHMYQVEFGLKVSTVGVVEEGFETCLVTTG